jgi:hypothetical protein
MNVLNTIKHRVSQEKTIVFTHVFDKCNQHQISFADVKSAISTGSIYAKLTNDPQGTKYILRGLFEFYDVEINKLVEREMFIVCRLENEQVILKTIYIDYFDVYYE